MEFLCQQLRASPIHARVVPYVLIVLVTFFQEAFTGDLRYWMYVVKTLLGAWCIWTVRDLVSEARWALSWEAVAAGVVVFLIWVGLDPFYPRIESTPWNPYAQFGEGTAWGLFFIAARTLGSAIVVPPIEEAFYRSFLYRYLVRKQFAEMPFNRLHWLSLIVTSALFGAVHHQWLAGFLCGLCYQAVAIRKNRLGDAITAHAITNFLLGIYIPWKGAWQFW